MTKQGYFFTFIDEPQLTSHPPYLSYGPSHRLFQELQRQVHALLEKGAVEPADPSTPGVLQPPFPSPQEKRRMAPSDRSQHLQPPSADTPLQLRWRLYSVNPDRHGSGLLGDLKDAFFHISVAARHRKYPRFQIGPRHYHFKTLPFGAAISPYTSSPESPSRSGPSPVVTG